MKKIIYISLLFFPFALFGQQMPLYSQYMLNDFVINPAVAGTKSFSPLRLNVRSQWAGLGPSAPQTNTLSFHAPLNDGEMGLGGVVFQEKTGPYSQFGLIFSYAFHVKTSAYSSNRISFGISGLLTQHSLNQDELEFKNPDPDFEGGIVSKLVPDATFGVMLHSADFFASLSVHQLFESVFREGSPNFFGDNEQVRHYMASSGFKIHVNKNLFFEPSVFIKTIETGPVQFDFNSRLVVNKKFWSGVSIRSSKSLVALVGMDIGQLHLGYGFDFSFSSISSSTSGSHEISLGYNIPQPRSNRHTYYW